MRVTSNVALEPASASNVGKGNGRAETRRASAAANLLNMEGNQKRRDPESVLKVETVVVTVASRAAISGLGLAPDAVVGFGARAVRDRRFLTRSSAASGFLMGRRREEVAMARHDLTIDL